MRLRKEHGVIKKLKEYSSMVIIQEEPEIINWKAEFKNNRPIRVEVGTGKGQFIIEMAKRNPEINFIGIELREQVLIKAVKKASEYNMDNLKFLLTNAINLADIFEASSINRLYLNFSDPWPKNRHYKRRLTHRNFIEIYNVILESNSWVEFKTDNIILFQFTLNELAELKFPMKKITLDLHNDIDFENNIMTEYEEKFSEKGNKIMSVTFQTRK